MRKLQISLVTLLAMVMCTAAWSVPGPPTITWPTPGALVQSNAPDITWTGDASDSFQLRICSANDPNNSVVWDSTQVYTPNALTCMTGYLTPLATYYVFVRLHDGTGWGNWSASGNNFYVNGQLLSNPSIISANGLEWWDHAVYNPDRNEYLITWNNNYTIHWRILDRTGNPIGTDHTISDGVTSGHHFSVAAYNSVRQEYLIEYAGWIPDNSAQARVVRVDATNGNQVGSSIWLYSTGGISTTGGIRVAYSPTSNSYLATYEAASEGGIVYGQILDSLGNRVGANFRISTLSQLYSRNPAIAWNSASNEYLVTYQGYVAAPTWDYWAQRVRASDGALQGVNRPITTTHDSGAGSVAYDSDMNRYLVINESGDPSPWGQFVSASGELVGSRFPIGAGDFRGGMCNVVWNPTSKEYLATWAAFAGPVAYANWGRRISQTGALIGEPFKINGNEIGIGNWDPKAVYNSADNEYLIHWYNSYAKVEARRYKTYTPPAYAPGPVTTFTAGSGNSVANLSWTNPLGSVYSGTMIRYKTSGYPTSKTDGNLVVDKAGTADGNDSYTHTGLTNGVTYYYTAFAHDATPLYSKGVNSFAVPTAPICLQEPFTYADGSLNGNGGWEGSATANIAIIGQKVKITGGATAQDAIKTIACGDPGTGFITVTILAKSGVGIDNMWDFWIDDTSGLNLARWYGSGTTARGRIAGTATVTNPQTLTGGWDELKVKINPYANTSEFFFNRVSIGVLDHGQTGAGNTAGRLRFTRGTTAAADGNYLYFDDLTIGDYSDTAPPGQVTNFTATTGTAQLTLDWTNPNDSDYMGTMIRYRTGGYPTSSTDGTLLCDRPATPGSRDSYVHSGLSSSTYFYSAFSYDKVLNRSLPATTSGTPGCVAIWLRDDFESYSTGPLGSQSGWSPVSGCSGALVCQCGAGGSKGIRAEPSGAGCVASQLSFDARNGGYHYLSFDLMQDASGATGQEVGYVSFQSSAGSEIARVHVQKGRMMMEYGSGSYAILTNSASNATWYKIKVGFNVDSRTIDVWLDDSPKVTSYGWKGSGTNVAKVVVGADANAVLSPQRMYVDNLVGESKPGQIAQVRDDGSWTPSLTKLHFSFDPVACAGEYRYAIGTTSGGTQARNWTSCGQSTDVTATGLSLVDNQTYYVTVQVGTGAVSWGVNRTSDGIKVAPGVGIQAAKALANGGAMDVRALRGKAVSAAFPGYFYVQEPGVPFGIKALKNASVNAGDMVDICGLMRGAGAERYLDCDNYPLIKSPGSAPDPAAMANLTLGGVSLNANTPGVVGGIGLNNIGLLVTINGKVTAVGTGFFYLDDGSGVTDTRTNPATSQPYAGVRVLDSSHVPLLDEYWSATGVSSLQADGSNLVRALICSEASKLH